MKKNSLIQFTDLVFSKWTRKSYAVFVSLQRVVKIAQLAQDICTALFCGKAYLTFAFYFKNIHTTDIVPAYGRQQYLPEINENRTNTELPAGSFKYNGKL